MWLITPYTVTICFNVVYKDLEAGVSPAVVSSMRLVITLTALSCVLWQVSAMAVHGGWNWEKCRKQYEQLRAEVRQLQETVAYLKSSVSKYSHYYVKGESTSLNH